VGIGTVTPGYQFQLSDGTNPYFSADKTTRGIKIGRSSTLAPSKTLDIAGDINFDPITPPTVAGVVTAALTGSPGNVPNGTIWYTVAYYDASGNVSVAQYSQISIVVSDNTTNGQVQLSNIPTSSDPRVVGRKIYRGAQYSEELLATIANNTATTYLDNLATTTASDNVYRRNNYTAGRIYSGGTVVMQVPSQYLTSLGVGALSGNTTGSDNVAIGASLSANTTGSSNIGIGSQSSPHNTTGSSNIGIGQTVLYNNNTGSNNIAIGDYSLRRDSTLGAINYNTGIGLNTGRNLAVGSNYNTLVGYNTGASALTGVGGQNIMIGAHPGTYTMTSGSYNILMGYNADVPAAATSNFLNIGQLIYGTGLGTGGVTPSSTGKVGIGNSAPGYMLHVGSSSVTDGTVLLRLEDANSTCDFNANTGAPSCGSDITLKKNINDQSDNLSKIIALRPVTYNWLTDEDGADVKHGFIAQEVADIIPELVTDGTWVDGSTRKFLQTAGMTPYIVGAIKEMNLKLLDINDIEKPNDWRDSLIAWFANAENHITRIFTGEVCLTEAGQETVCLNRSELQSLKALINSQSSSNSSTTGTDQTTDTTTTTNNNSDTTTNENSTESTNETSTVNTQGEVSTTPIDSTGVSTGEIN
jgi:hypothetical protein